MPGSGCRALPRRAPAVRQYRPAPHRPAALSPLSGPWAPLHANRLAGSCVRVFLCAFCTGKACPVPGEIQSWWQYLNVRGRCLGQGSPACQVTASAPTLLAGLSARGRGISVQECLLEWCHLSVSQLPWGWQQVTELGTADGSAVSPALFQHSPPDSGQLQAPKWGRCFLLLCWPNLEPGLVRTNYFASRMKDVSFFCCKDAMSLVNGRSSMHKLGWSQGRSDCRLSTQPDTLQGTRQVLQEPFCCCLPSALSSWPGAVCLQAAAGGRYPHPAIACRKR